MFNHVLITIDSIALGTLALLVVAHHAHRYDGVLALLKVRL